MKKLCFVIVATVGLSNAREAVQYDSGGTLKEAYNREDVWGVLTSIDLHDCNPEKIRSADAIRNYVEQLCELIGMRRFGECHVVNFGENEKVAGFSMTQWIETSLISGHFANLTNAAYIDIFSCGFYDSEEAIEFTKNFFEASDVAYHITVRS